MAISRTVQMDFGGGVNAQASPHLVASNEVAAATNIDFTLERGAAEARRGWTVFSVVSTDTTSIITDIYRNYNQQFSINSNPFYVIDNATKVYSGTGGVWTAIATGGVNGGFMCSYRQYAYLPNGTVGGAIKDDGTQTTDWVKLAPPGAPTLAVSTRPPIKVSTAWTCSEGSFTNGSATNTTTATASSDAVTNAIQFDAILLQTNLNTNGFNTIGQYGIYSLQLSFDNPNVVTNVSCDYSIGDNSYTNYFHTELPSTENFGTSFALASQLIANQVSIGTGSSTNIDLQTRRQMLNDAASTINGASGLSGARNSANTWATQQPNFFLVNIAAAPVDWTNIQAARVVIQATGPVTVKLTNWIVSGDTVHPLHDPNVGIAYWQTYAKLDSNGNKVGESAPSPASTRFQIQAGAMIVSDTNTTVSSKNDITHKILYRQGGYLQDAYAVATYTVTQNVYVDGLDDISALSQNFILQNNVLSSANFPGNSVVADQAYFDRIFISNGQNVLQWSLPAQPDLFPFDSFATISNFGDNIQKLIVWMPVMIIVNDNSVYEMVGTIFEGPNSDFSIVRTGCRQGSIAHNSIIKTPYGIFLVNYNGLSLYNPGQGIDTPITWAMEKMADAWRGNLSTDPAALKGNRIPAINIGNIYLSCAAYNDQKIYFGVPTGSSTYPNTLFVLDFRTQQIQSYTYGFSFASLFWDWVGNTLLAGTTDGRIVQIEHGTTDNGSNIQWNFTTRQWTSPNDAVLENALIEYKGSGGTALAILDNTSTITLGTLTSSVRTWTPAAFLGTVANNVQFQFVGNRGTSSAEASIYQVQFDAIVEPAHVQYWKADYEVKEQAGEFLFDAFYADLQILGSGNVLATAFVDGVALGTTTYSGPTAGRHVFVNAYPPETYGRVSHIIYQSTASPSTFFKPWNFAFDARPEPPRVNYFKTDIQSQEEQICDAVDIDVNPNGTLTSTVFLNNVAVGTYTSTGSLRQSYSFALPNEEYARTIYAIHNGTAFKHYKTWWHLRPEPDRWTNFVSDRTVAQHAWGSVSHEAIWDAFDVDINCFGNVVLATAFVDTVAVSTATITGSGRQSYAFALPNDTFGRVGYVVYNAQSGYFKHYGTWYTYRPEPDRLSNYVSDRSGEKEFFWHHFECEIAPLGATVLATAVIDNVGVATYTITGSNRQSYAFSLPIDLYGRTVYGTYNCVGTGKFKHYKTWFEGDQEPDRLAQVQLDKLIFPSEHYLKTWIAELNPLGTCTGVLYANDVQIAVATFTGTTRQSYRVGLDVDTTMRIQQGYRLATIYTAVGAGVPLLKHYNTSFDTLPKPFGKNTWAVFYQKIGGASQLDIGRFWSIDLELDPNQGTATVTSIWDVDGYPLSTNTLIFGQLREWRDRIPFPPGMRGYLFRQRLISNVPIEIWRSSIDTLRTGVKGLSRVTTDGVIDGKQPLISEKD